MRPRACKHLACRLAGRSTRVRCGRAPVTFTLGVKTKMHALLDQIEGSLASKLYFLSLYTSLSVPDIAGALCSANGEASGKKYIAWYETWVRPRFAENANAGLPPEVRAYATKLENPLDGESCYQFRCSLLHQGRTDHPKSKFGRIIFIEPGATTGMVHYCLMNNALCIDLPSFCKEMLQGARAWLASQGDDPTVKANLANSAQRYPAGLRPYIGGVAVIG